MSGQSHLLDPFIPNPDICVRHQITVGAPAELVFEVASAFDIQSIWLVRFLFWLRAKFLGADYTPWRSRGLIVDMLAMGWQRLDEGPGRYFTAGATCEPWMPDAKFTTFSELHGVKIALIIEAEPLGPNLTRLATETRVVATNDVARVKFRAYWRKFRIGIVMIRWILLRAVRRQAETRAVRK